MATESGPQDLDVRRSFLGEALRDHPGRFDFFQVVRLIELMYNNMTPVGAFGPAGKEPMRFAVNNSLNFPPSQIHSLEWPETGRPKNWTEDNRPLIKVNFMGLTGPKGVLPTSYTELVRDRERAKPYDRAMRDFFDLFNHRMISLFYQAWKKYRFFVPYERTGQDRFSDYLSSFVGLGTTSLRRRQKPVRDESFLYYCGLLALQPKSAASLEQILADYFDVQVEVEQFIGAWYSVAESDQCHLDWSREEELLGAAIAGDEVWDRQSRARVVVGPMPLRRYREFLPGGTAHAPLRKLLRFFAGNEIEFEVQLVLAGDEVPQCRLELPEQDGPLLGWTSWIKSGDKFGRSPGDAILLLN